MAGEGSPTVDAQLLAGTLALALLTISPGADMALVARVALGRGTRAAFFTTLGICSGLPLHAAASALGISAILATSAQAFTIAKLIGAAYLVWLGVQSWRHAGAAGPGATATPGEILDRRGAGARPGANRRLFVQGFLSNALNPKVALFYLAFLPQFMRPDDPVLARSLLFAAIHALQGIVWLTVYARALDRLGTLFRRSGLRTWLERASGAVLVALGLRLAGARNA
jgi:threonine/homoserine/homoserine lactone efflux protein